MQYNFLALINLLKEIKKYFILSLIFIICVSISGCPTSRFSILTRESSPKQVAPSEVKFHSTFKTMSSPWQIEGMISAVVIPLYKNTPENRQEFIRNTVADMGINTVVGVQTTHNYLGLFGSSSAILANIGEVNNDKILPKFITFLPVINYRIEKDSSMDKLDDYLREHIQYFLSYQKGYYVYNDAFKGITYADILQGNINPNILTEPLGIAPDYAVLCDVEGHEQSGSALVYRNRILKITLTLFDIKENKVVWTSSTTGGASQSFLAGGLVGLTTDKEETSLVIQRAIINAMDSLPKVAGFRVGPGEIKSR